MKSRTAIRKSLKEILTALNYDDELEASIDIALVLIDLTPKTNCNHVILLMN